MSIVLPDPTPAEPSEPVRRLTRNAARCLGCGEVVESRHRWDYQTCTCGALACDGGLDYVRRAWRDGGEFEDLCEWEEVKDEG